MFVLSELSGERNSTAASAEVDGTCPVLPWMLLGPNVYLGCSLLKKPLSHPFEVGPRAQLANVLA